MKIDIDLIRDWKDGICARLLYMVKVGEVSFKQNQRLQKIFENGAKGVVSEQEKWDMVRWYYNWKDRIPKCRPREVKLCRDVTIPPVCKEGWECLRQALVSGEDLRPWMSNRSSEVDYFDAMYRYWRIFHFHLGEIKNGRVARTGPIAYCYFDEQTCYLIAVEGHKHWADPDLIKRLNGAYPDVLKKFECADKGYAIDCATKEYEEMRKHMVNAIERIDDERYMFIGSPISMDGNAGSVWRNLRIFENWLKNAESIVRDQANEIGVELTRFMGEIDVLLLRLEEANMQMVAASSLSPNIKIVLNKLDGGRVSYKLQVSKDDIARLPMNQPYYKRKVKR